LPKVPRLRFARNYLEEANPWGALISLIYGSVHTVSSALQPHPA
jgi:hypothetical protein